MVTFDAWDGVISFSAWSAPELVSLRDAQERACRDGECGCTRGLSCVESARRKAVRRELEAVRELERQVREGVKRARREGRGVAEAKRRRQLASELVKNVKAVADRVLDADGVARGSLGSSNRGGVRTYDDFRHVTGVVETSDVPNEFVERLFPSVISQLTTPR